MNVLILGNGGREHALTWAISRSPRVGNVICAPGNAGTHRIARGFPLDLADAAAVLDVCRREDVNLVVIGPEAPLVAGLADTLRTAGLSVFGPGAEAARLEGSKAFSKEMMESEGVPTARSATVRSVAEAAKALEWLGERVAVKADGLAAGKGVVMASDRTQALDAVRQFVEERTFGSAGERVVLEEWLEGEEVSVIAFVDGDEVRALVPSQDHKRAYDGDRGPNTGGMGAYAPYPGLEGEALERAVQDCLVPIVRGLARRGVDYRGVLYAGLMLTSDGPRVLEYNVRFGDPETQVILPLFDGDLLEAMEATANGTLAQLPPFRIAPRAAMTVVAASAGYPAGADQGRRIAGLDRADDRGTALVFHAGTEARDDAIVTAGGRVLAVTGLGESLAAARQVAYETLASIHFDGMQHRTDIGARALGGVTASGGNGG
ncbi:MAG: phosphoribosylamine--glycine ligase [Gemmatimonadota bacterium]|nr:MAG: phosphoribosylamine--glycine ligase [Gemmatimonadota bacterium]